jgi:hypothetical protein
VVAKLEPVTELQNLITKSIQEMVHAVLGPVRGTTQLHAGGFGIVEQVQVLGISAFLLLVKQLPEFVQLLFAASESFPFGMPGFECWRAQQGTVVQLPSALHSFAEQALPKGVEPVHSTK